MRCSTLPGWPGLQGLYDEQVTRMTRPDVRGFNFCGHAKPGLDSNQYLAGSPSKRLKLSACQADAVPSSPPPSSSGTPIKLPKPAEVHSELREQTIGIGSVHQHAGRLQEQVHQGRETSNFLTSAFTPFVPVLLLKILFI